MHRSIASLVHRRGHILWFRKAVPVDLVDRLGCSDIRRSLRTSNMRIARQRAWALILRIEEAFAVMRNAGLQPDARIALRTILSRIMDDVDPDNHSWAEREKYSRLIETLANPKGDDPGIRVPISLVERGPDQFAEQKISLPDGPDIQGLIRSAVQDAMIDERARKPFSAFLQVYLATKEGDVRPKTLYELGVKIRVFMEAMGDLPVHLYTRQTLKDYCALLQQMPKDAIKHLKTDNLRKAIAMNAKRKVPLPTLTSVTIEAKYLSAVRGLFQYLVVEGVLKSNPASFVKVEGNERDEELRLAVEKRLPFTHQHVRELKALSKKRSRASIDYWWTLLLPYTGLRLAELAQLNVADIRQHYGRWCIDLLHTPDGDVVNAERRKQLNQSVKTLAGYRVIPLPKPVLASGFLEFVEERRKRSGPLAPIFFREKKDKFGEYGKSASKRLNAVVDKVIDHPQYVVHSARHYFIARCKEIGMPEDLRCFFVGHEDDDDDAGRKRVNRGQHVGKRYGSPMPSEIEFGWIDKLLFDVSADQTASQS